MFVSEQMAVSEAKELVRLCVKRQRRNGLNIDQAIHREAIKSGVPQSEIKSLWCRTRQTVSAAVLDNLRDRYEAIYEQQRQRLLLEIELSKLRSRGLDADIKGTLEAEIREAESTCPPVAKEQPAHD